ncbi:MAG: hypothetical protein EOO08_12300 [Chitinophagaceae bacterium]|nr:MAG: hypothetical protein EOO08_12300 [Chitinophagaceae bacterium]
MDLFFDDIALQHYNVMELYNTDIPHYAELVSAHVIGRHLARMLHDSPELRARVAHILEKREGDRWQAMHSGMEEQR